MKSLDAQIKNLSTVKYVFFLIVIVAVILLEVSGVYLLYKEHLYYIILLFLFAELISSVSINLLYGVSVLNVNNFLLLAIIGITVYLSYLNKQATIERLTNQQDGSTESTGEQTPTEDEEKAAAELEAASKELAKAAAASPESSTTAEGFVGFDDAKHLAAF